MLPIIYMLWSIECFDFSVLFKEFCFIVIECFKLLVSQNNMCVCVGGGGGGGGGSVRACVHCYC